MPIMMTIAIRRSVGGPSNDPADVRAVQKQLNGLMNPPRVRLAEDGKFGPKTAAMIRDFQKVVVGMNAPDGRVDPNGRTLRALNDPASEGKWARMSMPQPGAPVAPPVPGAPAAGPGTGYKLRYPLTATPAEKAALDALVVQAQKAGDPLAFRLLDEMVKDANYGHIKNLLTGVGAAQWIAEFGAAIQGLRMSSLSAAEILIVFRQFGAQKGTQGLSELLGHMKAKPAIGKTLGKWGKAMTGVAIFYCVLEVVNHVDAGRYGAAAGEIYSTAMSTAIPWAGMLDAVQTLLFAYAPGMEGRTEIRYFFRFLNAVNPIGAGKIGVDSIFTIIETLIISFRGGKLDTRKLDQLVQRMKASPLSLCVEVGESLADVMADRWGQAYYEAFLK